MLAIVLALPVVLFTALLSDAGGILLLAAYGIPGLVLAVRRPGQPIAWLLLLMALGLALGTARVTASIDERQREAVVLKHLRGRTLAEIAAATGRSVPAVVGLLRRGLDALRERLA